MIDTAPWRARGATAISSLQCMPPLPSVATKFRFTIQACPAYLRTLIESNPSLPEPMKEELATAVGEVEAGDLRHVPEQMT